ncbi:FMN-binding protein [Marinilabiliaceae bacterium JC017]|nr:FMN-binding protein [Marinilabiliaceae bacterium JC017]
MSRLVQIVLVFVLGMALTSFDISPKYEKKIKKELQNTFMIIPETWELLTFIEDPEGEISTAFYLVKHVNTPLGYFCITQGKGRFETFDFIIIYDETKHIKAIKILEYRSGYGYEICTRSWLKQFCDYESRHQFQFNEEVEVISGATISSRGLTEAVNKANVILNDL